MSDIPNKVIKNKQAVENNRIKSFNPSVSNPLPSNVSNTISKSKNPLNKYLSVVTVKNTGIPWYLSIPTRLWFAFIIITMPLRIAAWLLETAVAACTIGIILTVYLWWSHVIPDEQVALFLGEIGNRGLQIITKSGVGAQ